MKHYSHRWVRYTVTSFQKKHLRKLFFFPPKNSYLCNIFLQLAVVLLTLGSTDWIIVSKILSQHYVQIKFKMASDF